MEDAFKNLLNQSVKPIMKAAGFKKKVLNFYKQEGGMVFLVNLQKSHGNSSRELGFYVNCCIHSNLIESALGKPEQEHPKEYQCHFRDRIEKIATQVPDKFLLNANTDLEALHFQVKKAMKEVMAFFDRLSDHESFVLHLSQAGTLHQNEFFQYCVNQNLRVPAENLVKGIHQNMDSERWEGFFKEKFRNILAESGRDWKISILG